MSKKLCIIYHSKTGNTQLLADAVYSGAQQESSVQVELVQARSAGVDCLLNSDAVILGTPENFGYMSGALKDFFDRTYYEVEAAVGDLNIPYAVFISAGNDGSGAVREIDRIVRGYPLKKVLEPIICQGKVDDKALTACAELGETLATGLGFGIY